MPLFEDDPERQRKKLKFHCANCGAEIITRFLRPGDILICKFCNAETTVPGSASETDEAPTLYKQTADPETGDKTIEETAKEPTPWGLVSVLKYYGVSILFFFTMTCLASFVVGIKYGYQKAANPGSPPPAPDYSAIFNSISFNLVGTVLGWALSIGLIYYIVVKRHHNKFLEALHLFPVSRQVIKKYALIALGIAFGVVLLGLAIYSLPVDQFISKEIPIEKFLNKGYKEMTMFTIFAILAPFPEEVFFRGFLFQGLAHSIGRIASAIIVTVLFVFSHGGQLGFDPVGMSMITIFGAAIIIIRIRTDSLSKCIIVHLLYNTALLILTWVSIAIFGFSNSQSPV